MSETRPPTVGEQVLVELQKHIDQLRAGDNELLASIASVLQAFLDNYDTENDIPECPSCGEGCRGHDEQTYHLFCSDLVQLCECIRPYVRLALQATEGTTDWAATARDLISGDPQRVEQHLLDLGDGGRDLVFCAGCNTLAMPPHVCESRA